MAPIIPSKLELKGKLITLRTLPQPESHGAIQKILSDPLTMQHLEYMSYQPNGWALEQVQQRHQRRVNAMEKDEGLSFIVYLNISNEVVGSAGFNSIDFDHRHANIGRIIHHPYWGSGVGTECQLLMWEHAFEVLKLHRIEFGTFEKNIRVRKGAERLGIQLESIAKEAFCVNGVYEDDYIYALFDRDWGEIKKKLVEKLERQIESSRDLSG
jgi:RimJ/RimL family protein N-acetyltransferase